MKNTNTQDNPIMDNGKKATLPTPTEETEISGEELETVSGGLRQPPLGRTPIFP
ncbi:MAG: hypothetical protein ACI4J1_02045 [Ruminiclostridium sp.]